MTGVIVAYKHTMLNVPFLHGLSGFVSTLASRDFFVRQDPARTPRPPLALVDYAVVARATRRGTEQYAVGTQGRSEAEVFKLLWETASGEGLEKLCEWRPLLLRRILETPERGTDGSMSRDCQ